MQPVFKRKPDLALGDKRSFLTFDHLEENLKESCSRLYFRAYCFIIYFPDNSE
jgi:hypothetical protein